MMVSSNRKLTGGANPVLYDMSKASSIKKLESQSPFEQIRDFLRGVGTDDQGRTVQDYLNLDDEGLDQCHDFIQWMFPTFRTSGFNPTAPNVTPTEAQLLSYDTDAMYNYNLLVDKYLEFLVENKNIWQREKDHNLLRISRLLESLALFNKAGEAHKILHSLFALALTEDGAFITKENLVHWHQSANLTFQIK